MKGNTQQDNDLLISKLVITLEHDYRFETNASKLTSMGTQFHKIVVRVKARKDEFRQYLTLQTRPACQHHDQSRSPQLSMQDQETLPSVNNNSL